MTAEPQEEFKDTPTDNARRWSMELAAAKKKLSAWHADAAKAVDASQGKKVGAENTDIRLLNLFGAGIQMRRAQMYGRPPRVSSSRRFGDSNDDVARVASEVQERLLNTDIERDSDTSAEAFDNALLDSLVCDFAQVRARYVVEMEKVPGTPAFIGPDGVEVAAVEESEKKAKEDVEILYTHWRDCLWSPARVWSDVTWVAFLNLMPRAELVRRFGEEAGKAVPLNAKHDAAGADASKAHPWGRAEVWEIWDKDTKQTFWLAEGHDKVLSPVGVKVNPGGGQPDPLGLDGFFPCPKPLVLNASTSAFVPRPDYMLAKDIYDSINTLETRCGKLTEALKVAGVYNKENGELKTLLDSQENELIPVSNWAMFAEGGGMRGAVDWFPVEQVANTLNGLRDVMRERIDLLYQVTGESDLSRGQATQAGATATEQRAKVKYGSVRLQRRQDAFAAFVSDAQRIKAQIISKHFSPETILDRCNCEFTEDRDLAPQAVQLLKDRAWQFRIEVKPEAMALQDFGALKEESLEVLTAIGAHIQTLGQLAQTLGPQAMTFGLEVLKVSLARLKGGDAYEGLIDKTIAQVEAQAKAQAANPQPQQPDPKILAQQMKGAQDIQKIQAELQADLTRTEAEVQADAQREQNQAIWNVREATQKQMVSNALRPPTPPPTHPGGIR